MRAIACPQLALKKAKMECFLGGPPTRGLWLYLAAEVMGGMTRSCTARTTGTAWGVDEGRLVWQGHL
jgi:hypothetical protein